MRKDIPLMIVLGLLAAPRAVLHDLDLVHEGTGPTQAQLGNDDAPESRRAGAGDRRSNDVPSPGAGGAA